MDIKSVKKLMIMLFASIFIISSFSVISSEAAGGKKKKVYKAYYKYIQQKEQNGTIIDKISLADLDNDGIPEMILLGSISNPYKLDYYNVCIYNNNKITTVTLEDGKDNNHKYISSYIPKSGKLMRKVVSKSDKKIVSNHFYTIKNSKCNKDEADRLATSMEIEGTGKGKFVLCYSINGIFVSKSEYDKKLKEVYNTKKAKPIKKLKYISKEKMLKKLSK